jgi:hypothetical protein
MDKRLLRRQMHPVQVGERSSSAKELARASGREQIAVDAKTVGGSEYPSLPPIFCVAEKAAQAELGVFAALQTICLHQRIMAEKMRRRRKV